MEFLFDFDKNKEKVDEVQGIIEEYKGVPGGLIPVLQKTQDILGYLPKEVVEMISKGLDIPISEIYGVATFYTQFSFIPKGENIISVCLGTACYVKGAQDILEEFEKLLGIKAGGTTQDLKFTISSTRCVGDCSMAPVVLINDDVYPKIKKNEVKELINKYI